MSTCNIPCVNPCVEPLIDVSALQGMHSLALVVPVHASGPPSLAVPIHASGHGPFKVAATSTESLPLLDCCCCYKFIQRQIHDYTAAVSVFIFKRAYTVIKFKFKFSEKLEFSATCSEINNGVAEFGC
jgi:hypothetical protein